MSNWPYAVGLGALALFSGRRREGSSSGRITNVGETPLPDRNRLAVDVTITDDEGNLLLSETDVPSGGVISAPNRTTSTPPPVDDDVDTQPAQRTGTVEIGTIVVEQAAPSPTGAPPPPSNTDSGGSTFSASRLRDAARRFVDAWLANGKNPLKPTEEFLITAVQRAATTLLVDGRYGPRTAGAVQWAIGGSPPSPWDPTGPIRAFVPPR